MPLIILDIGSSLVEGPSRGPASRIAEAVGLDTSSKRELHRLLMTTDYADPEGVWADTRKQLGLVSPAVGSAIADVWRAQEEEARLIGGAFEVLQGLAARGYRLALLSNIWTPYLRSVRRLLGDFFDAYIPSELQLFSCREGLVKPSPELFERVLERAGVDPASILMVGDSYNKDIAPAAMFGMHTLWLLHDPARERPALIQILNGAAVAPTLTLRSLADLDSSGPWLAKYLPCSTTAGPKVQLTRWDRLENT
jgi:HAD superfamily hydrolase (TIGR01549 family)